MTETITHTIIAVALLAAYCIVTLTGHDGTPILLLLGGQGITIGATKVAKTIK